MDPRTSYTSAVSRPMAARGFLLRLCRARTRTPATFGIAGGCRIAAVATIAEVADTGGIFAFHSRISSCSRRQCYACEDEADDGGANNRYAHSRILRVGSNVALVVSAT